MFEYLPDEILIRIFCYIDYNSINNIRLVCKRFSIIGLDNGLWRNIIKSNLSPLLSFYFNKDLCINWREIFYKWKENSQYFTCKHIEFNQSTVKISNANEYLYLSTSIGLFPLQLNENNNEYLIQLECYFCDKLLDKQEKKEEILSLMKNITDENPIPKSSNIYYTLRDSYPYYEVIIECFEDDYIPTCGIGLVTNQYLPELDSKKFPGWDVGSIGYHSDDGDIFIYPYIQKISNKWGIWGENDIIGCGYIPHNNIVFFTNNGDIVKQIHGDSIPGFYIDNFSAFTSLFAMISVDYPSIVRINFGQIPFLFDKESIFKSIIKNN